MNTGRAIAVWGVILLCAIANGGLRQALLIPLMGERNGRIVSTLLLSAIVLAVTWLLLPWIGPASSRDAWVIGALWVVMTLAFEFLAGHYLFGSSWESLLADYNLVAGRIWVLVLIATFLAPIIVFRSKVQ